MRCSICGALDCKDHRCPQCGAPDVIDECQYTRCGQCCDNDCRCRIPDPRVSNRPT